MSVQTMTPTAAMAPWNRFGAALPALALGVLLIGLLFRQEVVAAVNVWYASTAYSHCFFVIPIAAYLLWDRRYGLDAVPIRPVPLAALAMLPVGLAWLLAERIGVMEGRQLMVVTMLQVLFVAVLGFRMWWALSAGLLYLYFLVPFGAFLTPALQNFTAAFIPVGLDFLGIPNYSDALTIDIPAGRFFVAEACAGLRFLIASVAFGVLYAALIYRSPWRRAAFIAASIVVPIVANGFRALGIVVLGHVLGSAEAAAADHLIYGWAFFSFVIVLLVLAGMPFRQDDVAPARSVTASPPPPRLVAALTAACAAAVLAASAPAVAGLLDRAVSGAGRVTASVPAGCQTMPSAAAEILQLRCAVGGWEGGLTVVVQNFPARANPGVILAAQRRVTAEAASDEAEVSSLDAPAPPGWRLAVTELPHQATATLLWIDGQPTQLGLRTRIAQARAALSGAERAPVLVSVAAARQAAWAPGADAAVARRVITAFLVQQRGWLDSLAQQAAMPAMRP